MSHDIITSNPETGPELPEDIDRLKAVARTLLVRLEEAVAQETLNVEADSQRQSRYERLFVGKTSLASTLLILADLMFRLDEAEKGGGAPVLPLHEQGIKIEMADFALMKAFLERVEPA